MRQTGLTERVRKAMRSLGLEGNEITAAEVAVNMAMICNKEKQKLYRIFQDFIKSGEITRIRPGVYTYNDRNQSPQLQQIMWRCLRAKKTVIIDDLIEISGASREYAAEWIYMLVRREIVEKIRLGSARKYRLISDPVIMPVNEANRKKLRRLRKQKKREALVAIGEAQNAISRARKAVGEIPE